MKIKKYLVIAGVLIFTISYVSISDASIKKYLIKNTDTIKISFYAYKSARKDVKNSFEISSKDEIKKIIDFISGKKAPFYKGSYHGSIDFLRDGKSLLEEKMEFNLHDSMRHIVYIYKKKLYSKKLTEKGISHLEDLQKKIPYNFPKYVFVKDVSNLKKYVGKKVTVEGKISNTPWQHLIKSIKTHQEIEYFDIGNMQIVIYSKKSIKNKKNFKIRIKGKAIEVKGKSKGPKPRETFTEYHVVVDKWEYVK